MRITHLPSGLAIEAEARRESLGNLEDAVRKLRLQIALLVAPDAASEISVGASQAVTKLEATPIFLIPSFRIKVNPTHFDFPIFVFRALYFLAKYQGQVSSAAQTLGCTASALVRFFKIEKAVWSRAKEIREANGLHPLK